MRIPSIASVAVLWLAVPSFAGLPTAAQRDKALEEINSCVQSHHSNSRCKHLNRNVEILVDVYRGGDKSVLPTLFRFTYLRDFYDEALISDPQGFLSAMAQLSENEQQAVAAGLAGGLGPLTNARYQQLRKLLVDVPEESPNRQVAQRSLKALETNNARLFADYFPPQTFTSPAADMLVYWYSREMYALGDQPLWPASEGNETTYRLTYLGSWTGPKSVTLIVRPDGAGEVRFSQTRNWKNPAEVGPTVAVSRERVADFFQLLQRTQFWDMAVESELRGFDGAEWILEGVQDGRYHVVTRWCPGTYDHIDAAFAQAARLLFELSGHKHSGGC